MIDTRAKVHPSVIWGRDVRVWAFASIHEGVILGDFVSIGEHTYVGIGAKIGSKTRVSQGCYIVDHMTIGQSVFIGPHVVFTNDRYPIANNPNFKMESPIVEDNVSIGAGAVILPGVYLGAGCMIGAGAVVTKSVPSGATVYGNPARIKKRG